MKRNTLRTLALILVLVFCASMLVACFGEADPFAGMTEAERAFALYKKNQEKIKTITSVTVAVSLTGSFHITAEGGTAAGTIFSSGTVKESGIGTESYAALVQQGTNITVTPAGGEAVTRVQNLKEGFQNGKMFKETKEDDAPAKKLFSTVSAADYAAYSEKYKNITLSIDASSCTTATSTLKEDGSWLVTFTGFTAEYVAMLKESFLSGMDFILADGQKLADVRMAYTIGADYAPIQDTMEFVFANEDPTSTATLPVMTQAQVYTDLDATTVETVDLTGYTDAGDLRQFTIYQLELNKRVEATMGSFDSAQQIRVVIPGITTSNTSNTYAGSFTSLGGFAYTILGTESQNNTSTPISYSYADGVLTENNQSGASTDAIERSRIKALLDPAGFTSGRVEVTSVAAGAIPGTYVFTVSGLAEELATSLSGAVLQTKTETLTATYDALTGALTASVVDVNMTLAYMGVSVTMTVTISCTYK